MQNLIDQFGWGALLLLPVVTITISVAIIAVATLLARRPATRRHCLQILAHLTQYVSALRGRR